MSFCFPAPAVIGIPIVGRSDLFPVRRVYCVGRNYVEHAQEMGFTGREPPFFFCKPADAVVSVPAGATGEVAYPPHTANYQYEVELVAAIGKPGRCIKASDALAHVFGYAVGLDMTRRDLQMDMRKQGRPWEIGKAFDESAPIGPLRLAAQCDGIDKAAIRLDVNGTSVQRSTTAKLIWTVAEVIEHLSSYFELQPGDLIYTGTPEGVGAVVPGDAMLATIDGFDALQVKVAAAR